MFILESILTDGIAQLSYLVGDTDSGNAAVIDPRTDVEVYESLARKHGVAITHVFETHIHADFVSGSRSLAERVGTAKIYLSDVQSNYQFEAEPVSDNQVFDFGAFRLIARHTPGHTPEHLSFELCESDNANTPWAVFTGDSLFVGSAGRPDLLGAEETEGLAKQLYETLYEYFLKLEDFVTIYPGHGAGSACGANIGDRLISTIGYERRHNTFLKFPNFDAFRTFVVDDAPPAPWHYPRLKKLNAAGPEVMDRLPTIPALPPYAFRRSAREPGVTVIDTRSMLAFGGGHIPGAINIGNRPEMSAWVGQMLDLDERMLLIVDQASDIESIERLIVRTGHSNFAGYLCGGMKAWEMAGLPLETLPQISVEEMQVRRLADPTLNILDVRSPDEWNGGHIPGAEHYFIAEMRDRITGLDKDARYAAYCASGYRASIASSLMRSRGFKNVANVPGSWSAWMAQDCEVEKPEELDA
ncbi:putative polyketide biosynthesis zinc-dependent hydrolase PksB [Roseimaritima multifibrata]|uniref:Putative polyketide biosynthesis zinc-dependent hydrolase PksB n=1 Tax=Roseimaritima multifibrata TaxID=1930274 RepID=A0A517MLJ2_9BACT|nr:rhodanese-like domain-containing protein [Roseimaritima multifibrata]QDS95752.1 putative polyketide biosynthesis zinc-dependent hydrolase PksB [Roseimaritima multifibrata]